MDFRRVMVGAGMGLLVWGGAVWADSARRRLRRRGRLTRLSLIGRRRWGRYFR